MCVLAREQACSVGAHARSPASWHPARAGPARMRSFATSPATPTPDRPTILRGVVCCLSPRLLPPLHWCVVGGRVGLQGGTGGARARRLTPRRLPACPPFRSLAAHCACDRQWPHLQALQRRRRPGCAPWRGAKPRWRCGQGGVERGHAQEPPAVLPAGETHHDQVRGGCGVRWLRGGGRGVGWGTWQR